MLRNRTTAAIFLSVGIAFTAIATLAGACQAKRIESSESPTASQAKAEKNLWMFSQHTDGARNYTVCVTGEAIKFVSDNMVLIARKPDWNLSVMNEKNRRFCEVPLHDFHGLRSVERFDVEKLELVVSKTEEKIVKRAVENYAGVPVVSDEKVKKLGFAPNKILVAVCSDVTIESGALSVLSKLYGLEGLKGLPLRIRMTTAKGEEIDCLNSSWCFKRGVSPTFFEVPKRFTKGKDLSDVENNTASVSRQRPKTEATSHHVKQLIKSGSKNPASTK